MRRHRFERFVVLLSAALLIAIGCADDDDDDGGGAAGAASGSAGSAGQAGAAPNGGTSGASTPGGAAGASEEAGASGSGAPGGSGATAEGGAGGASGNDSSAGAGGISAEPRFPCDVEAAIAAKCQRCHSDPTLNGAPFPLLTWQDTQMPYGSGIVADAMHPAIETDFMPFTQLPLIPPVEPLTAAEKELLLDWLEAGSEPVFDVSCEP